MPVNLTVPELAAAMRVGDSAIETVEITRLLSYSTVTVEHHAPDAPDTVHNEAAIRIASYLYDQPGTSSRGSFSNALRNSGAARILLPYRIHKVGSVGGAVVAAQSAGSDTNPVVGIAYAGDLLTVTYADGDTDELTIVAGGGGGVSVVATATAMAATADGDRAGVLYLFPGGIRYNGITY